MRGSGFEFGRMQLYGLLEELCQRLGACGVHATIRIFGGTAVALGHDSRRVTRDIDAAFSPSEEIVSAVREMAVAHNLPDDWLNSRGAAWLPEIGSDEWLDVDLASPPGVTVQRAPARALLAMKLASSRLSDFEDLPGLLQESGIETVDEGIRNFHQYYPSGVAAGRTPSDEDLELDLRDALAAIAEPPVDDR